MRKAFLFVLCLVFYVSGMALPAFSSDTDSAYRLEDVEILHLRNRALGVAEVSGQRSGDFRPVRQGSVRFWDTGDSLWLRISMPQIRKAAESLQPGNAVLVLGNEYISFADFFLPLPEGEFKRSTHGLDTPLSQRSFPSRYPTFHLESADEGGYAYLNVQTSLPVSFGVYLQTESAYYGTFIGRLTQYIAFYGFMAALILTYLFFYFMTGDGTYIIVVLRQLGAFVFLFAFNGYLQYYFNLSPHVVYVLCWLALGLHCVAAALFSNDMVQMDTEVAWIRKLTFVHAFLGVVMALSAFTRFSTLTFSILFLALAMDFLGFVLISAMKFRQGYRLILLFLLSRIAFMLGVFFLFADILFVWSTNLFENLFMISFLLDPILLAFMLIPGTRRRFENYFSLEEKSTRYELLSQRDGMTNLYNKANLLVLLDENIRAAQHGGKSLAFIMMDIDHFKKFNDTWGHPEGDKVILFLAKIIRQCLRESDIAARYGGEEFSIILPGGTLPSAVLVAERIRKTFEQQSKTLGEGKSSTVSLGISFLNSDDTVATLIQRADDALYRAKGNGRNRTEFEVTP